MRQILSSLDRQGTFDPTQMIINKFFRLAPSMYALLIACILLGDPNTLNVTFASVFAFIGNYSVLNCNDFANTTGQLWSNAVELQLCVAGAIVCYALHKIGMLNMKSLLALFGLSFVIGYLKIHPENSIGQVVGKSHFTYYTARNTVQWIKDEYDFTLLTNKTCSDDLNYRSYMSTFYLPTESRYGGFVVGLMLAYQLHHINKTWKTTEHKNSVFWNMVGYVLFGLSSLLLLLFLAPGSETPAPENVLFFITIAVRQLFALALAFIIYCTLVPSDHPFHAKMLARFFGMRFWYPLSVLSYGVYILHYRLMFVVAFGWLRPKPEEISAVYHLKFWLILMGLS
eukprot:CAMPEP_0168553812 /NCGR_PEP_ID=MMETSP0413-20121227/7445_1 /TAXON_ID=136452 /ORGANISM="Filamoeba nolandi, Strain NC-AS-23-1" /LENGTH=340 /DNA_ID=CAMNT_0008584509 /DNA_START=269 /DNA_END=1287 /DNA_ORIENTATION=-